MSFPLGKVPSDVLHRVVFRNLGTPRKDVILGPAMGEDAALIKVGHDVIAIATDPITGATQWVGWLAVNISANDVATCGVPPQWFTSCILLPRGSTETVIQEICSQMDQAARQLDLAIIGGHCEITPGIEQPIVVGSSAGIAKKRKYVTSSGAKIGDNIIITKGVGLEGTAILASDRRKELKTAFPESFVNQAEEFFKKISVVPDALIAVETGGVSAMHDPTEGGVAGGLHELADASQVGFEVYEERIPILEETRQICSHYKIDPLQLISSGALLITINPAKTESLLKKISSIGTKAAIIGKIISPALGRKLITRKGEIRELVRPTTDHLWVALSRSGNT